MGSLAQVLRMLPGSEDPDLLVSPDGLDDAGVYRLRDDLALVQTVDFFPPLVDDPWSFGQIAAANSLSDVYAMGGRPVSCLNIVGFPDKDLPTDILVEILRGGHAKITEAGAVVAGGHSVRDSEIKYGLAVTGIIHPQRIVRNRGAEVGDCLVLTKPLGSGNLTTAYKKGRIDAAGLQECIAVMSALNDTASAAMLEVPLHAATDITGFGLIGHAHEMATASARTLVIQADRVPLMEQVTALAGEDLFTRAANSNLACVGDRLDRGSVDERLVKVLAEAQTSGGLLISIAQSHADQLLKGLKQRRTCCAEIIGEVQASGEHTIILR